MDGFSLDDLLKQIKTKPHNENGSSLSKDRIKVIKEKVPISNSKNDFVSVSNLTKQEPKKEALTNSNKLRDQENIMIIEDENESNENSQKEFSSSQTELFYQMKFAFILFGQSVTKKRIEILTPNIKKRGGKILNLEEISWNDETSKEIFVATSTDIKYEVPIGYYDNLNKVVIKLVPDLRSKNINEYCFINCDWISDCLRENQVIDPSNYKSLSQNVKDFSSQNTQDTMTPEISKLVNSSLKKPTQGLALYIEEEEFEEENRKLEKNQLIGSKKCRFSSNKLSMKEFGYLYDYDYQFAEGEEGNQNLDGEVLDEFLEEEEEEDDLDEELMFLGSFPKGKSTDSIEWSGTLLEGVEGIDETDRFKNFKLYNPANKAKAKFWDNKKETFVCQVGAKQNYNQVITDELEKLLKVYTNEKDIGRMHAYRKAVSIIRAVPFKIETPEQIKSIKGLGVKLRDKLLEITKTGKLKKAEILTSDEKQITIELFTQVWGIGVQTAINLYSRGLRTIEDLRTNKHLLSDNQKIGLKYLEELKQRMSRDEVTQIVNIVKNKVDELAGQSDIFEVICCGSYRRGKETCGDIDILITRKDGKSSSGFIQKLVKSLEGTLLKECLASPRPGTYGSETYMGICCNGGLHRRIDIKVYPRDQFGYAVLYFTGSDYFNRSMRLFARKKGYTLSDHGLYPAYRNKQEKVWKGENIPCYSEEDVFKALGLQYRAPNEREV